MRELTDEEIKKISETEIPDNGSSTLHVQRMRWNQGASWYRDFKKYSEGLSHNEVGNIENISEDTDN